MNVFPYIFPGILGLNDQERTLRDVVSWESFFSVSFGGDDSHDDQPIGLYHSSCAGLSAAPQMIENFLARVRPDAKRREREKGEDRSCRPSLNAELLPRYVTAP